MTKPTILITTAAGKTGYPLALNLLARGFPVRAFVHRKSERAASLRNAGADIFVGNQFDILDVRKAMKGVQRAYCNTPMEPHSLFADTILAAAADEARLESLTVLSQWHPSPSSPALLSREEWLADRVFEWLPIDVVTLNPGFFADNYMTMMRFAAQMGVLVAPLGQGKNAPPSNEDIARVAAATLADPAPHVGKTYRPTGPELLSPQEIADVFGRVAGRKVRYVDAPVWRFKKAATAMGFPPRVLMNVEHFFNEYRRGTHEVDSPNRVVETLTGKPAEDFETVIRRYAKDNPDAKPSFFGLLRAIGFTMKILLTPSPDTEKYAQETHVPTLSTPLYALESEDWCSTHDPSFASAKQSTERTAHLSKSTLASNAG